MIMKKDKISLFVLFAGIFLFFLLFYTQIHPLIPYNSDDWMFMSANRIALPSIHAWNPSRVLPETLMPLFSDLAAYAIYPFTHDYIDAQNIMHSAVMSFFIMLYMISFNHMLRRCFNVQTSHSILYTLLFLLLHFLIFRTADTFNVHLFYSDDLTCHYFYLIPNLVNAMLVMSLIEKDWLHNNNFSNMKNALLLLVVYLAICSNLYCSDILVIFVGCQLLLTFPYNSIKERFVPYIKANIPTLCIIALWMIINVMELMGPRSAYLAKDATDIELITLIGQSISAFLAVRYNVFFLLLAFIGIASAAHTIYKEKKLPKFTIHLCLTIIVTLIYVILVSAKAKPSYSGRADILFAVFFPVILLMVLSWVKMQRYCSKSIVILPLLMLILFSQANRTEPTFRDLRINSLVDGDYSIETLRRVDNSIIEQIVKADKENRKDSVFITVPHVADDEKNWPYLLIFNNNYNWLNKTLLKQGLIERTHPGKFVVGKDLSEW